MPEAVGAAAPGEAAPFVPDDPRTLQSKLLILARSAQLQPPNNSISVVAMVAMVKSTCGIRLPFGTPQGVEKHMVEKNSSFIEATQWLSFQDRFHRRGV
jgi:hypothetical protein